MSKQLILASASRIRQSLLTNAGLTFTAVSARIDERLMEQALGEVTPQALAAHLAQEKARDVSSRHPGALVIGCDQTMSLGKILFHKAASLKEARHTLELLRAKTHHLHSAVCLVRDEECLWSHVSTAALQMRDFSLDYLELYLQRNADSILGSVGCYQLEGEGINLFDRIEGDYFTILGLPLLPLLQSLRSCGVNHE